MRLLVSVLILILGEFLVAQTSAPPTNWPAPRSGAHAMAFDAKRGVVLLYGDRAADAGVLWAWDGATWTAHRGAGPGLRRHIKLAYDAARDRTVMYGGYDDNGRDIYADTWEWDGETWHRFDEPGPGPRSSYSLVYDPIRRHVLLFGGLALDGPKNDTWTWNGEAWSKVADTGPSPRGEAGIVFDPIGQRIMLSGGMAYDTATIGTRINISLNRSRMPSDTWTWDGRAWTQLRVSDAPRMAPLTLDPISRKVRRTAGETPEGYFGDLQQWTDNGWAAIANAVIPERHGLAVALDTRRQRLVMYGGFSKTALGDLWEWDGRQMRNIERPQ